MGIKWPLGVQLWDRGQFHLCPVWYLSQCPLMCQEFLTVKHLGRTQIGAIGLKPGDLVLVKADAFQGKRKVKDRWEDKPHEVVHQIATDIPSYEVKDQYRHSHVLHHHWLHPVASEAGVPFVCGCLPSMGQMNQPLPSQAYSWREWQQDYATRRWWSDNHHISGQEDFSGVD